MTDTKTAPAAPARAADRRTVAARKEKSTAGKQAWVYGLLVLAGAATVLPFVWMLLGSFKTQGELLRRPVTWWPQDPTLDNYLRWFSELHIDLFFMNSLIVAVVTVLG